MSSYDYYCIMIYIIALAILPASIPKCLKLQFLLESKRHMTFVPCFLWFPIHMHLKAKHGRLFPHYLKDAMNI